MFEKDGWYSIRAAGSHGVADVIAIRPAVDKCADPWHFEVKFLQVKTSQKLKQGNVSMVVCDTPAGWPANVEMWFYPSVKRKKKDEKDSTE